MLPEIKLETRDFVFKNVKYDSPLYKILVIENTGQVVCQWVFLPKPGESRICKKWLTLDPTGGLLIPGEKAEIRMTVHVDSSTAPALNLDKDNLEDILVLHLQNGRDHFITVSGIWMKSCFGNTIENLVTMHQPIRLLQEKKDIEQPKEKLRLPKELWRLVDYIYKYGIKEV